MGSGASASPSDTPEPSSKTISNGVNRKAQPANLAIQGPVQQENSEEVDDHRSNLVRTNQVAPIIIKNCKEEFQHVSDFKDPIVFGRIAENMPEHALIKNNYFLVADITPAMDKLNTLPKHLAPNFRRIKGKYPIFGLGQPTKDGIYKLMCTLKEEGHKDIMAVNVREEPVLFVQDGFDMMPYSPRHLDSLTECLGHIGRVALTTDLEVEIRKETVDLASFRDDHKFYFYDDIDTLKDDPHMISVAYEDNLAVTDEIYSRLTFNNSNIKYLRLCCPQEGAPLDAEFDAFIDAFRTLSHFFESRDKAVPALVFTGRDGIGRTTFSMAIGCLMLSHKIGFPKEASKNLTPPNDKSPNYERGEFFTIRELVKYLPNGYGLKQEVDVVISLCDEVHDLRAAAAESKTNLEAISEDYIIEGISAKEYFRKQCIHHLERYFYLICLNAYLHDQYETLFGEAFSHWLERQPHIYNLLNQIDVSERSTSNDLLKSGVRFLVADNYLGLDVLSSQMEVKTSNFRRVPGLPVYGMAQPSREGLHVVVQYLQQKRQGHPKVIVINLREDLVVECDGTTFSVREANCLDEPIIMPYITSTEIQTKENKLRDDVKLQQKYQVYLEVDKPPENREFTSILTPLEMCDQQLMQSNCLSYHRIPMTDDCAPKEREFDLIMAVVNGIEEIHTDEDGPAIVFHCRTGKGRTTTAMAIAGLIICHKRGFPYGTKPGEEERVSLPNARYTQGHYKIVQEVVRRIPNGQQVKREVDFILNQCSDTMTPMHYHVREVIFVTYNKIKKAKNEEERLFLKKRSLDYLERYIYLILFNTYLHCERRYKWRRPFSQWMTQVAAKAGMYELLDSIEFSFLDNLSSLSFEEEKLKHRRCRWSLSMSKLPFRGEFT